MNILTPFQKKFIQAFSVTPLKDIFFLTGGTALSEFFLQHRLSEDLDFFTEEPGQIPFVLPHLEKIIKDINAKLEIKRQFRSYLEVFIYGEQEEVIKCDFAQDSPYRLKDKLLQKDYGIFTDNLLDIACNKLSALFDRNEPKDFVDIYFLDKEFLSFDKLLTEARKKHIGLDDYWLSVSFSQVDKITLLPKMIKPLNLEEMKDFFRQKATILFENP